jgi:hypothetical protein
MGKMQNMFDVDGRWIRSGVRIGPQSYQSTGS